MPSKKRMVKVTRQRSEGYINDVQAKFCKAKIVSVIAALMTFSATATASQPLLSSKLTREIVAPFIFNVLKDREMDNRVVRGMTSLGAVTDNASFFSG